MQDTNLNYANMSNTTFNNLKLKDTTLINSYMQDSILKNVKFDNIDFTEAQIFNTRLKDIDLSTCIIQGLSTTLVDIKGAIMNELQIMDLAYLLNIKIKDYGGNKMIKHIVMWKFKENTEKEMNEFLSMD